MAWNCLKRGNAAFCWQSIAYFCPEIFNEPNVFFEVVSKTGLKPVYFFPTLLKHLLPCGTPLLPQIWIITKKHTHCVSLVNKIFADETSNIK